LRAENLQLVRSELHASRTASYINKYQPDRLFSSGACFTKEEVEEWKGRVLHARRGIHFNVLMSSAAAAASADDECRGFGPFVAHKLRTYSPRQEHEAARN